MILASSTKRLVLVCNTVLLQSLGRREVESAIHQERDVREEHSHVCGANRQYNRMNAACDLYCCLQPQREALHSRQSASPIATGRHFNLISEKIRYQG